MTSNRQFAVEAAKSQDSLLQSSRLLFHLISLILILVGTFLTITITVELFGLYQIVYGVLFAVTFVGSLIVMRQVAHIIESRKKDVDYWHRLIIIEEEQLPQEERLFTLFKISQKYGAEVSAEILSKEYATLTTDKLDALLAKPPRHARHIFESTVPRLYIVIWAVLIFTTSTTFLI